MPNSNKKKIIVASSAGFCWGVQRAFDKVMEAAKDSQKKEDLYTYGPLIHNPEAVKMLEREGVNVIEEIPQKLKGGVFIRTHGISPNERAKLRDSGVKIYDATCPDVGIIQGIVKGHLKKGYYIVIVGNSEHPEVKALLGFAEGKGLCIQSCDDVKKIPEDTKNLCVVAQSTQIEEDFVKISNLIKEKHPGTKIFNTICRSTASRQEEVKRLSKIVDAMVVVGGKNSANTNKLAQISAETGTPTFHIEDADELKLNDFGHFDVIGVTAGASTPGWSISQVIEKLKEFVEVEVVETFGTSPQGRKKSAIFLTSND